MSSNTNFATWNPLTIGTRSGLTNGNTTLSSISTADLAGGDATMGITSGKYYWEIYIHDNGSGYIWSGLSSGYEGGGFYSGYSDVNGMTPGAIRFRNNGTLDDSSAQDDPDRWGTITLTSTGVSSYTDGDIMMYALDYDNKKLWIGKNGTFFNSGNPAAGSNQQASWNGDVPIIYPNIAPYYPGSPNNGGTVNFGQDSSFAGNKTSGSAAATDGNGYGDFYYTPPTDYLSLNSANALISNDIDPAQTDDDFPQKNFNVVAYDSTGSGQSITGVGFQPDLVWVKWRGGDQGHGIFDSTRGTSKVLNSDATNAEATSSGLTSFDSDGYTMGQYYNQSGREYVGWCWRANGGTTSSNTDGTITTTVQANTAAGFSIVKFSGNGSNNATVGHGLDSAPDFIICKPYGSTLSWHVFHRAMGTGEFILNSNSAFDTRTSSFTESGTTATNFTLGSDAGNMNYSGVDTIAYCWHSVEGYSKFGSYTANGISNGPFIYTGFRPRLIFIKNASTGGRRWTILDSARNTFNPVDSVINWDESQAEYDSSARGVDFLSNGFKIRGNDTDTNQSGNTMVYGAWGDVPFKYNNTF